MRDETAVCWQGTVADGSLSIGDWSSWRWGRLEYRPLPDLATCFAAIEEGICIASMAPAVALSFSLTAALFNLASDWGDDVPGDDLDSALLQLLDRCAPLLEDPMLHWAIGRLRDCSDAHLYILGARELSARLFMEARRVQRELDHREQRLIAELLQQREDRCCRLLATDNVCYGPMGSMLAAVVAQGEIGVDPGPYGDLLRALEVPATIQGSVAIDEVLVVAAYAVDDQPEAHFDPACAETIANHLQAGGSCWLLVPRYAHGRPGRQGRDRCSLPVDRFERLITETWSSGQPAVDAESLGVADGGDTPSLMQ